MEDDEDRCWGPTNGFIVLITSNDAGDGTQGLAHANQVLCPELHPCPV